MNVDSFLGSSLETRHPRLRSTKSSSNWIYAWINFNINNCLAYLYSGDLLRYFRSCRENRTAYAAFNLNKVFNVDASSDYNKWPGLMDALDSLKTKRVRVELDLNRPPSTADALRPIAESTNLDFEKFRSLVRFIYAHNYNNPSFVLEFKLKF